MKDEKKSSENIVILWDYKSDRKPSGSNPKRTLATSTDFPPAYTEDIQPDVFAEDFAGCVKGAELIYK